MVYLGIQKMLNSASERNISLNSFASIIENKNLNFINLQYGNHENAIKNLEDKIGRKVFK